MPTLTLEVTIRLSVEREWFIPFTDAGICWHIEETQAQIYNSEWDSVHVRVAPTEETPANG